MGLKFEGLNNMNLGEQIQWYCLSRIIVSVQDCGTFKGLILWICLVTNKNKYQNVTFLIILNNFLKIFWPKINITLLPDPCGCNAWVLFWWPQTHLPQQHFWSRKFSVKNLNQEELITSSWVPLISSYLLHILQTLYQD